MLKIFKGTQQSNRSFLTQNKKGKQLRPCFHKICSSLTDSFFKNENRGHVSTRSEATLSKEGKKEKTKKKKIHITSDKNFISYKASEGRLSPISL